MRRARLRSFSSVRVEAGRAATIDLTVRAYPGHVQPDKVKTDLPQWTRALKQHGGEVTSIAADINDAKTANVEDVLGTMQSLGIRFVREPKTMDYGTVAVFEDLYGNRWDLIQLKD